MELPPLEPVPRLVLGRTVLEGHRDPGEELRVDQVEPGLRRVDPQGASRHAVLVSRHDPHISEVCPVFANDSPLLSRPATDLMKMDSRSIVVSLVTHVDIIRSFCSTIA